MPIIDSRSASRHYVRSVNDCALKRTSNNVLKNARSFLREETGQDENRSRRSPCDSAIAIAIANIID